MFQTELIIFLQSFASEYLTAFFKFFTEIGKSEYAAPLVLIVMFGISFRVGFILLHAVSWNGLITYSLKEIFALPRPSNVDIHVKLLGETAQNITPFESMGGKHFFGGFPKDILGYIRIHPFDSWGFPSGHASHAVTLWGSISLYLEKDMALCLDRAYDRFYLSLPNVFGAPFSGRCAGRTPSWINNDVGFLSWSLSKQAFISLFV